MIDASLDIPRRLNDPPRMFWWDIDVALLMLGGTTTTRSRPAMCIAKAASVTLASIEQASSSTSSALARRALAMSARSQSSFIRPARAGRKAGCASGPS